MANFSNDNFMSSVPAVTRNLLIINVIVWLACFLFQRMDIAGIVGLNFVQSKGFYLYQLVTYMFTHEEFSHLFFNMFALFMFGSVIERTWGPKRYLMYYIVTGVGAALVQMLVTYIQVHAFIKDLDPSMLTPQNLAYIYKSVPITVGASGAVFGLLLAFGMLFPNAPLYLMFIPIPIKAKYFVIGYGVIEFFFGIANRSGDNVAHFAHLGGMLFGIFMILYWKKKGTNYGNYFF